MIDHTRHSGIFLVDKDAYVTVIGAGGIGSFTLLALAKMGFQNLTLFDAEKVEEENTGTQLYGMSDVGLEKVTAMGLHLAFQSEGITLATRGLFTPETEMYSEIVISAVDSISSRQDIWHALLRSGGWRWYIDARMAAEEFQCYAVHTSDQEWYNEAIFNIDDEDIPDLPCTQKATVYTGFGAAALVCSVVKKIIKNEIPPKVLSYNFKNFYGVHIPTSEASISTLH